MSEVTNRVPVDKSKVMQMFKGLPHDTQVGIAGALFICLSSDGQKGGQTDARYDSVDRAGPC